jgi:hypothetical protein
VATDRFNADRDNIRTAQRTETELRDWFGGSRSIPGTEEVIGRGPYGKTLTILSSDIFVDAENEEEGLGDRRSVRFPKR